MKKKKIWQLVITKANEKYKISVQDLKSVVETIYADDLMAGVAVASSNFEICSETV